MTGIGRDVNVMTGLGRDVNVMTRLGRDVDVMTGLANGGSAAFPRGMSVWAGPYYNDLTKVCPVLPRSG